MSDHPELKAIAEHMPHEEVAPAHGIAAIALSMAMRFHDITTVQDGAMYQQFKLEGRNLPGLHLDDVFETAMKIEEHLVGSSNRIAKMLMDAIEIAVVDDDMRTAKSAPTRVMAPWTEAQVEALKVWQASPNVHPFTCPGDGLGCGDNRVLIPTTEGWVCACGRYKQDWAHDFMMGETNG